MILNYNHFILEKYSELLFESLILETNVFFTKDFRQMLNKIKGIESKSDIASELLKLAGTDNEADITLISPSSDSGYVNFTNSRGLTKTIDGSRDNILKDPSFKSYLKRDVNRETLLNDIVEFGLMTDDQIEAIFAQSDKRSRGNLKVGRLINSLLPGKFTDKQIEDFTNLFKSLNKSESETFQVVEGSLIPYWYDENNYKDLKGTLGSSCMSNKDPKIFQLYELNPQVCKMLILVDGDKLLGRALLWKLDSFSILGRKKEGEFFFLDRQYTINDSDVEKFREHAKERGWLCKAFNNHHSFDSVRWDGEVRTGCRMSVKLEVGNFSKYPYLDTFRRYDPQTFTLYNDDDEDEENEGQYLLDDTMGGFSEIETGYYSSWYEERIPSNQAYWSEAVDSWIWEERSTTVSRGKNKGVYPDDYDDLVWANSSDEWLHVDDTVYSSFLQEYIYDDDAKTAIVNFDGKNPIIDWAYYDDVMDIEQYPDKLWIKKLVDLSKVDSIRKDLVEIDYRDEPILKKFSQNADKLSKEDSERLGVEWLSTIDARILDANFDDSDENIIHFKNRFGIFRNYIVIDKFEYDEMIEAIKPKLIKAAKKQLKELGSSKTSKKLRSEIELRLRELLQK